MQLEVHELRPWYEYVVEFLGVVCIAAGRMVHIVDEDGQALVVRTPVSFCVACVACCAVWHG